MFGVDVPVGDDEVVPAVPVPIVAPMMPPESELPCKSAAVRFPILPNDKPPWFRFGSNSFSKSVKLISVLPYGESGRFRGAMVSLPNAAIGGRVR